MSASAASAAEPQRRSRPRPVYGRRDTIFVIYGLVLAALIVIVIASGWRSAYF